MNWTKAVSILFSLVLLSLSLVRWLYHDSVSDRMDEIFLGLIIAAFLVQLIPIERLKSIKAGGIEFNLDQPQIEAAIKGVSSPQIENEDLRDNLGKLEDEISVAQGARVLWIDDKPETTLSARRLLRALGIVVVPALSSEEAEEALTNDRDFDLIVSDVQRLGDSWKLNDGVEIHEGVNFIVKLRKMNDDVFRSIPVIFFAAYEWERLVEFTRPARELLPEPEITNTVNTLVLKVIQGLGVARSMPIHYEREKPPYQCVTRRTTTPSRGMARYVKVTYRVHVGSLHQRHNLRRELPHLLDALGQRLAAHR